MRSEAFETPLVTNEAYTAWINLHPIRPTKSASGIHSARSINPTLNNLPSGSSDGTRLTGSLGSGVSGCCGICAERSPLVQVLTFIIFARTLLSSGGLSYSLGIFLLLKSQHGKNSPNSINLCPFPMKQGDHWNFQ